ncbi:MAG TPA: hypothetical protein PLG23_06575 [Thermoflexales bacterium]|nr:hypothetical protein [Thermoflexales bacterium]
MIAIPAGLLPLLEQARSSAAKRRISIALVGGSVRDLLLGRAPHDLDFAVLGDAAGLARAVANALGGAFYVMDAERGTARVIVDGLTLDFARCRGATLDDDLRGRDLTLNAIAIWLPLDGSMPGQMALYDPLGGAKDLSDKVIRLASPDAIANDPVRAMRVARFAADLDARIDPAAEMAARAAGPRLAAADGPSAERTRDELLKALALPKASAAVDLLAALDLLNIVLPEAAARPPATLRAIDALLEQAARRAPRLSARLAEPLANAPRLALLRLVALCAGASPAAVEGRALALKVSAAEVARARTIRAGAALSEALRDARAEYRWMRAAREAAPEAALLGMALDPAIAEIGWGLLEHFEARYAPEVAPRPLLGGRDVLALGVGPGPAVGAALEAVREAQMIGEIVTREQALALARWVIGV